MTIEFGKGKATSLVGRGQEEEFCMATGLK
jgi:hypothetical protein